MYGGDKGEHDKTDDRLDLISSGFPGKVRAAIEPGDDVVDVGQRRRADDDGEAQKGAVLPHDAPLLAGQHGLVEARNRLALVAGLLEQVDVDSGGGELADGQMDHREVNDEARDSAQTGEDDGERPHDEYQKLRALQRHAFRVIERVVDGDEAVVDEQEQVGGTAE